MKIISWNLNGLAASMKSDGFLKIMELSPDIVCCQETKTQSTPEILKGYYHYWNPADRNGYSGTVTLTNEEPLSVTKGFGDKGLDADGRVITIELNKCFVVNTYAPNSWKYLEKVDYRKAWDEAFYTLLSDLSYRKSVIACGDFNLTLLPIDTYSEKLHRQYGDPGYAPDEQYKLQSFMDEYGFADAFRYFNPNEEHQYTHWGNRQISRDDKKGARLDYFIVSDRICKKMNYVKHHEDIYGSDHCPIELKVRMS